MRCKSNKDCIKKWDKGFTNLNKEKAKRTKNGNFIEFIEFKMDKHLKIMKVKENDWVTIFLSKGKKKQWEKKVTEKLIRKKWLNVKRYDVFIIFDLTFIVFFPLPFSPLIPSSPQQSPPCCPCL